MWSKLGGGLVGLVGQQRIALLNGLTVHMHHQQRGDTVSMTGTAMIGVIVIVSQTLLQYVLVIEQMVWGDILLGVMNVRNGLQRLQGCQ